MECLSRSSRGFRVTSGARVGFLFFRDGEIFHAKTGLLDGDQAAAEILGWTGGAFDVSTMPPPPRRTVESGWQALLMRAAQKADEANVVPLSLERSEFDTLDSGIEFEGDAEAAAEPVIVEVRVRQDGSVASGAGDEEFAGVSAFACQLASIVGDSLGLGPLVALESTTGDERMLFYMDAQEIVGLKGPLDHPAFETIRAQLGL